MVLEREGRMGLNRQRICDNFIDLLPEYKSLI